MSALVALAGLGVFVATLELVLRRPRPGGGAHEPNAYVRELRALTWGASRYVDTLFPHPYLGWVHHGNRPGGIRAVNDVGLFGQEFPTDKDEGKFVVLLTGGSVAAQFAQNLPHGPRYLEEELNRRYATADGRRFVVLNGGSGAWKQPQQAILFLLHCDVVDAVVTLDGWNEHYALTASTRLEAPAANFHLANPLATGSHRQLVAVWLTGLVDRAVRGNRVLRRSRAACLVADAVRRLLHRVLVERAREAPDRRTTVESLFALPAHYGPAETFRHAVRSYVKYVVAMNAVARQWGVKTAHFLQPAPAIGKVLTDDERAVVGDLSYGERYERMVAEMLRLDRLGIPVVSLTDLFAGCPETIYADWSHLARDLETGESRGYRLMAERMAAELATAWGLVRRDAPAPPPAGVATVVCVPTHAGGREEAAAVGLAQVVDRRRIDVLVRRDATEPAALVHLLGTSAYRVTEAQARAARARGVPYVLSPFYEDWAAWRVPAEALAEAYRARLGLPPSVDVAGLARSLDGELRARREALAPVVRHAVGVIATGAAETAALRRDFPGVRPVILPVLPPARGDGDRDRFLATFGTRDFVLCVGRLEPRKNQLALLEALADDPVDVVLATGGVAHRPDYLEAVRAFRRRGRTLLLPHLDAALLAAAFRTARVHVLAGWEELPGLATLEAVRAGCAVVASDRGTTRDVLGDAIPYAPPDDPAALRAAIAAAAGWSWDAARERLAAWTSRARPAWTAAYIPDAAQAAESPAA